VTSPKAFPSCLGMVIWASASLSQAAGFTSSAREEESKRLVGKL